MGLQIGGPPKWRLRPSLLVSLEDREKTQVPVKKEREREKPRKNDVQMVVHILSILELCEHVYIYIYVYLYVHIF